MKIGTGWKEPSLVRPPLCYEHMEVGVEVEAVSEGLDNGYHPGYEISVGAGLHVVSDGCYRTKA